MRVRRQLSEAPPSTAVDGLNAMMDSVVSSLRMAVLKVRARVLAEQSLSVLALLGTPAALVASAFTSTSEMRNALSSYLDSMNNIIDRLDGPDRADVLSGDLAQEKWLAGAQPVADGIQQQLQVLGETTTLENVKFTIAHAPSYFWRDISSPSFAPDLWKYAIPIGIAVGVIAFLPQLVVLSGFRRRR